MLATVGTRDVVRDLDVLRAALGDAQLTYLSYSYGTSLGAAYAEAFPATVRALVLDGAIDPAQTAEGRDADQGAAFTRAFQAIGCVDGITTCPFWPVPTTSKPHQPMVAGLPTVLIVSITGDPATPHKSGVNLAQELHGRLLTAEGTQHRRAARHNEVRG